jgi:hypothetical protein
VTDQTDKNETFSSAWWGIELPGVRACDGTYCRFPYEGLPPLPGELFQGDFRWLDPLTPDRASEMALYNRPEAVDRLASNLATIVKAAAEKQLALPASFTHLIGSPMLRDSIPSCTACYFSLSPTLVRLPDEAGYIVRFLNDQQDVLAWYLYVTPTGDHRVLVSLHAGLDGAFANLDDLEPELANYKQFTWQCAESFEAFIYRFWIENTIWFANDDGNVLTEEQQRYLNHYRTAA